jgi:4-amino-4-deoxy-L-arabinose transferase-like glycosyltransferase
MAGYLANYGAGEEQRERLRKWLIAAGIVVLLGLVVWWFLFVWNKAEILREPHIARLVQILRNRRQEDEVKKFLSLLSTGQYESAYRLWGFSESNPSKDYPFKTFMADWGPQSPRARIGSAQIKKSRSCGSGVIVTLDFGRNQEQDKLWVEHDSLTIGFSPWPSCQSE